MLHNVEVKSNVRVLGSVSGQDLGVWQERVVLRDSPNVVVRGRWDVQGNVSFLGSVAAAGTSLLNRVHLPSLSAAQESRQQQADADKAAAFRYALSLSLLD